MRVRLTRRLAESLNGLDLSRRHVGDILELSPKDARMLVSEGWATSAAGAELSVTSAGAGAEVVEQLRHIQEQMGHGRFRGASQRRAEDHIREDLHDARARTVRGHRH